MDLLEILDARPILIAIAGPNGAGKTTFYHAQLSHTGLPFVNADVIAAETGLGAYEAAEMAEAFRRERFARRESFLFQTVFSDPVGDKVLFLEDAAAKGYTVVLFFIGVSSAEVSLDRVAQRVVEGGHSVPEEKILSRYARVLDNLRQSLLTLPLVRVYDNDDLRTPYRFVLETRAGQVTERATVLPEWLVSLVGSIMQLPQ